MPIKPENKKHYPDDWPEIRQRILVRAGNQCECHSECGQHHGMDNPWRRCPEVNGEKPRLFNGDRVILTVAHLDHDVTKGDHSEENLKAYCQACHLRYDNKARREQHYASMDALVANDGGGDVFAAEDDGSANVSTEPEPRSGGVHGERVEPGHRGPGERSGHKPMEVSYNQLASGIHLTAVEKGWWPTHLIVAATTPADEERISSMIVAEKLGLMHNELVEAYEETPYTSSACHWNTAVADSEKVTEEIVDTVIRILDLVGYMDLDVDGWVEWTRYSTEHNPALLRGLTSTSNSARLYAMLETHRGIGRAMQAHRKKWSVSEIARGLAWAIFVAELPMGSARLAEAIEKKAAYNREREYMHGGRLY